MRRQLSPETGSDHPSLHRELGRKILRYATGSVVATVCSEATFLLLYGVVHASPVVASGLGWFAGAVPNYWLNRSWTWRRRGKPSLTQEVLPYVAIVLGTLLIAAVSTSLVHDALSGGGAPEGVRVALVGGTFLAVYGVVFLLRFFLLDYLFRRVPAAPSPGAVDPLSSTREPV